MALIQRTGLILFCTLLAACGQIPQGISPVTGFDLNAYAGQWYEIARLDHRFERGMERVTATYSINEDGSVRVLNRGYVTKREKWKDAEGRARFAGDENTGHLEVSFFGFFYGSYVIFELDKQNYQYAFVTGGENSLWFLARTPQVSDALKTRFVETVKRYGYDTDRLIFVKHD